MDADIQAALDDLKRGQETIEGKVDKINGTVAAVLLEIGGVPDPRYREKDRRSIRVRLHQVEDDAWSAKLVQTALEQAKAAQDHAAQMVRTASRSNLAVAAQYLSFLVAIIAVILAATHG